MPQQTNQFPPVYPASQQISPSYPVAPVSGGAMPLPDGPPSKKRKSYRVPIVVLSVVLVVVLSALGTVLYKLLTRDDSLAVGVKPAWEKPTKVKLAAKGEPGLAYTLYSPEEDKLILLQPFKDGSGIAQMLDPKNRRFLLRTKQTGGPLTITLKIKKSGFSARTKLAENPDLFFLLIN